MGTVSSVIVLNLRCVIQVVVKPSMLTNRGCRNVEQHVCSGPYSERQLLGEGDFGVGPLESGQPNADVIKGFVTAVVAGIFGGTSAS